mgnify:CR=1 FL=1
MAISFIGSDVGSAANGADVTIQLPAHLAGDLIIVAYAIGDNDGVNFTMAIASPTGYTKVADLFADDAQDANLGVFWKIAATNNETNPVVDGLGGADAAVAGVVMVFRGVDQTTPMDVTPTTATGINTMHPDPPSLDHLNPAGVWTVIAGAAGHTLTTGSFTFPTGYTVNKVDRAQDDTSDVTVGLGYNTAPADPENPGVMTHAGADSVNFAWGAVTMALRPASGAILSGPHVGTAVGSATRGLQTNLPRAAVAIGVPARGLFTTLGARTATGIGIATSAAQIIFLVTAAATAIGSAVATTAITFATSATAVAVGLATAVSQFIAGAGGSVLYPAWCYLNRALRFSRGVLPQVSSDLQAELYDANTQPSATSPRSPQV